MLCSLKGVAIFVLTCIFRQYNPVLLEEIHIRKDGWGLGGENLLENTIKESWSDCWTLNQCVEHQVQFMMISCLSAKH